MFLQYLVDLSHLNRSVRLESLGSFHQGKHQDSLHARVTQQNCKKTGMNGHMKQPVQVSILLRTELPLLQ